MLIFIGTEENPKKYLLKNASSKKVQLFGKINYPLFCCTYLSYRDQLHLIR